MIPSELYVPHAGWLAHEPSDEVARFLAEGWFEYREQAFLWTYARSGDAFIDCGAHVGLFSLIAARAMENHGTIVALEPHPGTAALLEQNLVQNGVTIAQVRRTAVFSRSGSAPFNPGGPGKSAYSSLSLSGDGGAVETITLDDLGLAADFVKIDVEGAELEVLKGAAASIRDGRLPLLMIECTEDNLQRFGGSTEQLFKMLRELNYTVCRFEDRLGELVPRAYEGPIGYDNLFAAQGLTSVNQRLAGASDEARRIADDILTRGRACEKLYRLSLETPRVKEESARARIAAEEAFQAGGEANWRAEQAEQRAEAAEKRTEEARQQVRASEARAEHARKHAEELAKSVDEAFRAGGEANWRAEQAELRAEESCLRADALTRSAQEVLRNVGEANSKLAQAEERTHHAHEEALSAEASAAQWRLRVEEMIASRYIRAGWKLGLTRKPSWIDGGDPTKK